MSAIGANTRQSNVLGLLFFYPREAMQGEASEEMEVYIGTHEEAT